MINQKGYLVQIATKFHKKGVVGYLNPNNFDTAKLHNLADEFYKPELENLISHIKRRQDCQSEEETDSE